MTNPARIDLVALIEDQKIGAFQLLVFALSCAVMFIEGYDMQVVAYTAPTILKEWHVSKAIFGPVFAVGVAGYMIGATLLSSLADRIGRKKVIIGGNLLFGVLTFAAGFATSIEPMLALRFVAGLGLGLSIPSTIALNAEYAPKRRRASAITTLFIGYTVGGALGGFVAAKLIPLFGWPSVFYLGGLAPVALVVLLAFALPESARFLALDPNNRDRILAILKRLRPELALDRQGEIVLHEEHQPGLPVKNLFTEGRAVMTTLLWLAFVTSLMAHYFMTSWLPTVLDSAGVPLATAVQAGGLIHLGGSLGALTIGWLLDRRGAVAIAIAFLLAAPALVLIPSVGTYEVAVLMPLVFLTGLFLLGGQIGLNALSGSIYPTYIRSTGSGWAFGVGRVGSILGPVVGGILLAGNPPVKLLFMAVALPVLVCAVITFALSRVVNRHQAGAPAPAREAEALS